ncbi:MAG: heme-binding protein [Boseongicola sp.]|nr:heme-binding protein [Boseongicola sp.]
MAIRTLFGLVVLALAAIPAKAEENLFVKFRSLTPEAALELAQATLEACRAGNYQVAVAIVDRAGSVQVVLRDRFAGVHTPKTAVLKARTAVSFRTNTTEMAEQTQPGKEASGVRSIPGVLMVGGGVMVRAAGELVGGIGVSGAPGGQLDEDCAVKGLEAIQDRLDF